MLELMVLLNWSHTNLFNWFRIDQRMRTSLTFSNISDFV